MPDVDKMNQVLDHALERLNQAKMSATVQGVTRAAIYLCGRFVNAIEERPPESSSRSTLEVVAEGAFQLVRHGRWKYSSFVLILEKASDGRLAARVERVS